MPKNVLKREFSMEKNASYLDIRSCLSCRETDFISRNYVVWPIFFLWMFSLLLMELIFIDETGQALTILFLYY